MPLNAARPAFARRVGELLHEVGRGWRINFHQRPGDDDEDEDIKRPKLFVLIHGKSDQEAVGLLASSGRISVMDALVNFKF